MVEWEQVRTLVLSFPDVEEDTSGKPRFRVHGKAFAWIARERDGGGLAVRVDREEKQLHPRREPRRLLHEPALQRLPRHAGAARGDRQRRAPRAARGRLADPGAEAARRGVRGPLADDRRCPKGTPSSRSRLRSPDRARQARPDRPRRARGADRGLLAPAGAEATRERVLGRVLAPPRSRRRRTPRSRP